MHFGDNPFGLPTNSNLEDVLKKNTSHTNPLEIKGYVGENGKEQLFPFWTPVKDPIISTTDYTKFWDKKDKALDIKKKKDKVGIVQPKDASKSYEDSSL